MILDANTCYSEIVLQCSLDPFELARHSYKQLIHHSVQFGQTHCTAPLTLCFAGCCQKQYPCARLFFLTCGLLWLQSPVKFRAKIKIKKLYLASIGHVVYCRFNLRSNSEQKFEISCLASLSDVDLFLVSISVNFRAKIRDFLPRFARPCLFLASISLNSEQNSRAHASLRSAMSCSLFRLEFPTKFRARTRELCLSHWFRVSSEPGNNRDFFQKFLLLQKNIKSIMFNAEAVQKQKNMKEFASLVARQPGLFSLDL